VRDGVWALYCVHPPAAAAPVDAPVDLVVDGASERGDATVAIELRVLSEPRRALRARGRPDSRAGALRGAVATLLGACVGDCVRVC
jgi:hypothetical protein